MKDPQPGAMHGILGVLYSIPVTSTYLLLRVLMRTLPTPERSEPDSATSVDMRVLDTSAGSRVIALCVHLYHRSFVRSVIHRPGDPCLFVPSCSEYALRAGRKYGLRRGLPLIVDRFRRCRGDYRGDFVDFP